LQANLKHPYWEGLEKELMPLCDPSRSDSANLDMTAELLVRSDVNPEEAMMILVPEAYR
jgi:glutamate synthase (ferredoxin)